METRSTKQLRRSLDNFQRGIRIAEREGRDATALYAKRNAVLHELTARSFAAAELQQAQKWSNR